MSKLQLRPGDGLPAEEYELQESSPLDQPLLPRYETKPGSGSGHSPHQLHELAKRHSSFRRALSCLCLAVFLTVPSLALAMCYFGRTTLDRVRDWNQLPGDVKEWLDKVAPGKFEVNPGDFPTE